MNFAELRGLVKGRTPMALQLARERRPTKRQPSDHTIAQQYEPFLGLIAHGELPTEGHESQIGRTMAHLWAEGQGEE